MNKKKEREIYNMYGKLHFMWFSMIFMLNLFSTCGNNIITKQNTTIGQGLNEH